jgi:hypothetical protein
MSIQKEISDCVNQILNQLFLQFNYGNGVFTKYKEVAKELQLNERYYTME